MGNTLVSIIVPVHNSEKYLSECIDSILQQTYISIQLVLVDDGSIDRSEKICKQYAEKDKRIKYIRNNLTGGVSGARNCGINNSDGRFVCFVDSDDYLEGDYVEVFQKNIRRYKVPVVFGQFKYLQDGKCIKRPKRIDEGKYTVGDIESVLIDDGTVTGIMFGSVCSAIYDLVLMKKSGVRFDESLTVNEDGVFNLDFLTVCKEVYVSYYDGYLYRKWKDTMHFTEFKLNIAFEIASKAIMNRHHDFEGFECQMKRRKISIVFWNAITIGRCDESYKKISYKLKHYMEESGFDECYSFIKKDKINIYKRILVFLLRKRKILIFYIVMKYIFKIMKRYR